jgi:hypothetical protein
LSDQGFDSTNNHVVNTGWNYDAAGNQTRVANGAGWERFQYDAANRLVKVKADDNVTVIATYTYAATDNDLLRKKPVSVPTTPLMTAAYSRSTRKAALVRFRIGPRAMSTSAPGYFRP